MAKSSRQILDALIEKLQPVLRDAFFVAVQGITNNVILKDLIKAIEQQDYERAFRTLGFSDAAMRPITRAIENIFEQGGDATGSTFPKVLNTPDGRTIFRFDVRNVRAENWIKQQSGTLITNIGEDIRVNVRNLMTIGLQTGNNPRDTALSIVGYIDPATGNRTGGIIGLNQPQELWVRNATFDLQNLDPRYFNRVRRDRRFDSIVQRAIDTNTNLDQSTITKLINRYKDNLLKLRGETVARTETIQSLNRSEYEAYKQAIDMGATASKNVGKVWDTAGDDRVRDDHADMEGQTVNIDEPFIAPDGSRLMFPGDVSLGAAAGEVINCRCKSRFKVDWLADID
jgi:hypothetical protein